MGYFWLFSAETWALLMLLISLLVLYGYWPYSFFKKLGIPGPKPLPLFGNMFENSKGFHAFDMECFEKYGRIWGIYDVREPLLCVTDRTIIKSVVVKECFSLFTNRRSFGLFGELYDTLFLTKDEDWKRIRSALTPFFTRARLKETFGIMKTHSETLIRNLERAVKQKSGIDVKDFVGAYTMDVITGSAFSIDIDSLHNPNDPVVSNVKKMVELESFRPVFLIAALFPFTIPLMEKMSITMFPTSALDFFFAFTRKIKADRVAKDHKRRVDFLQVMVDSQTPEKIEAKQDLNDHEVLCQAVSLIFGGYETSSNTLTFFFYNMATNPETMKKLQEEIDQTFPDKAPLQYDAVINMEYLDAALNESMRLYPVMPRIDRVAKKTVEINGLIIPKGTDVMIPIYPLHRDPEYWPDPDTFNPERFTKENKGSMDPYVFMPFGGGPRGCVGMRFALVFVKLAIVEVLRRFDVNMCEDTKVPLEMGVGNFLVPKDPVILKFAPRANSRSDDVGNNCSKSQ
ncbi:cytochrome P450 3A56-like [Pygocentrus nattereri]|uniref:cytochrome P450 3A56-like n=1 Tax=Pygocentrus nattereri TaxID=42514 RepID=UPI0008144C6B|nr:cytochrome P450 3A56-like [Pygocentrus nattereri]